MSQNQNTGGSLKLSIFIGSLLALFVVALIMTFLIVIGADYLGNLMLTVSILASMVFVVITAVMGLGDD